MVMRRRSKSRPMNADSQADSDTCCPPSLRCIGTQSQNCWLTTCYFVRRAWEVSILCIADTWACISRRCCSLCGNEPESDIRGDTNSIDVPKHDEHKLLSKEGKDQIVKPTSPTAPSRMATSGPYAQQATKPSSPSQPAAPHTISSTQTTVMSQPPSPLGPPTSSPRAPTVSKSPAQPQASPQGPPNASTAATASEPTVRSTITGPAVKDFEMVLPEPPKIDFIETGSIFGDRKRPTIDQSMFQLENGRFRSPGQSKVIKGPGGRTIRVSFVSGFPATKSLESYRSLATSMGGKQSRKSTESATTADKDKGNLEAGGSKIKKISSLKSVKSQTSQDSKDSTVDQSNVDKFNK